MVYDVKPIQISPELKSLQPGKGGQHGVGYLCWVVIMLSATNKRYKVVIFVTANYVYFIEKGNRLRRVLRLTDIGEVVVRKLVPPDTRDNTPCNWEVFIENEQHNEPGILFRIRTDRRNAPNTDEPSVLQAVLNKFQPGIPFRYLPSNSSSCCQPDQLRKIQGYFTPKEKYKMMKQGSESPRTKRATYIPPPQQQPEREPPVAAPPPVEPSPQPSPQGAVPNNATTGFQPAFASQEASPPAASPHPMYQSYPVYPVQAFSPASGSSLVNPTPQGSPTSVNKFAAPPATFQVPPRLSHLSPSSKFSTPPRHVNDNYAIIVCVRVAGS